MRLATGLDSIALLHRYNYKNVFVFGRIQTTKPVVNPIKKFTLVNYDSEVVM